MSERVSLRDRRAHASAESGVESCIPAAAYHLRASPHPATCHASSQTLMQALRLSHGTLSSFAQGL
eukprot:3460489-Rhodomonas_salina.3